MVNHPPLAAYELGEPRLAGSSRLDPQTGEWTLSASGSDFWERRDQGHFVARKWSGDFDCRVRLSSLEHGHDYTKAGLMARSSLAADAAHLLLLAFPDNRPRNRNSGGFEAQFRAADGQDCQAIYPPGEGATPPRFPVRFPHAWLRLVRRADRFECFVSENGTDWREYGACELALPQEVYLGMALSSHDEGRLISARFAGFTVGEAR